MYVLGSLSTYRTYVCVCVCVRVTDREGLYFEQKAAGRRIWREVLTGDPHKSPAKLLDSDKPV